MQAMLPVRDRAVGAEVSLGSRRHRLEVISATTLSGLVSTSTPRPGRSFGYNFPSLKSRHCGRYGNV